MTSVRIGAGKFDSCINRDWNGRLAMGASETGPVTTAAVLSVALETRATAAGAVSAAPTNGIVPSLTLPRLLNTAYTRLRPRCTLP